MSYATLRFPLLVAVLVSSTATADELLIFRGGAAYRADLNGEVELHGTISSDAPFRPWQIVSKDENSVWATEQNADPGVVYEVDTTELRIVNTIETNSTEIGVLAWNQENEQIFAAPYRARRPGSLVRIASDGAVTDIGVLDVPLEAMVFDQQGTLYGASGSNLLRIDPLSAETQLIGEMNDVGFLNGMAIDPDGDRLLAVGLGAGYLLFEIDRETAATTVLGDTLTRPSGLVFANVPEPSTDHLSLVLVIVLGIQARRRRTPRGA